MSRARTLLHRVLIFSFAVSVALAFGLKTKRGQASAWSRAEFAGQARVAITLEDTLRPEGTPRIGPVDIYTGAPFGTRASTFSQGLLIRATFELPDAPGLRVLVLDLDRRGDRTEWEVSDTRHAEVRYYVQDGEAGTIRFDGVPLTGRLELDEIIVSNGFAAFRIRGWVEVGEPGADRAFETEDDLLTELTIVVETVPAPEEVSNLGGSPTLPDVDVCESPYCYDDPSYYAYDPYYDEVLYEVGCGGSPTYEEDSSGCEGDTYDEPDYYDPYYDDPYHDDTTSDGSGCDGYDDDGYGDDGCSDSSSSGDSGCDSGSSSSSSSSGCSDTGSSSSSSGCGGCSGDTFDGQGDEDALEEGAEEPHPLNGGLGWLSVLTLLGAVFGAHRPRS